MALTLRNKHWHLFKTITEINPGFSKVFIPGVGIIRDEWAWCEENLLMMQSALEVNEIEDFNRVRYKLLLYCRYRVNNPLPKYEYPEHQYTITDVKPDKNYLDYSIGNIKVYLKENYEKRN